MPLRYTCTWDTGMHSLCIWLGSEINDHKQGETSVLGTEPANIFLVTTLNLQSKAKGMSCINDTKSFALFVPSLSQFDFLLFGDF